MIHETVAVGPFSSPSAHVSSGGGRVWRHGGVRRPDLVARAGANRLGPGVGAWVVKRRVVDGLFEWSTQVLDVKARL